MDFMKSFRQILRDQYDALEDQEVERTGQRREKPSDGIYDNAQWHYKLGFRKKVPKELGATHIAFFLRWCQEKKLLSESLLEKLRENKQLFADEPDRWSFRTFMIQQMNEVFSRNDLNETGQAFADVYYTGKRTEFAEAYGSFLENYDELVNVMYRLDGREYYHVKYIEANYDKVKDMLDQRYEDFLRFQEEG